MKLLNGNGKHAPGKLLKSVVILLPFTLFILMLPFPLRKNSSFLSPNDSSFLPPNNSSFSSPDKVYVNRSSYDLNVTEMKRCNVFSGEWVPYSKGPYYDNETCNLILDQQNCMKFGRPDREFLKWRWKPDECELPLFDATLFLEIVRGKSMAFVGDSVGRNQMNSLLCLLSPVSKNTYQSMPQCSFPTTRTQILLNFSILGLYFFTV